MGWKKEKGRKWKKVVLGIALLRIENENGGLRLQVRVEIHVCWEDKLE